METNSERCEVVVESHEVEKRSELGYRTIEIREEDITIIQTVTNQELVPNSGSYMMSLSKQVPVTLRILKFHMVKDAASHVAELSGMLDEAKLKAEALVKKSAEDEKTIAQVQATSDMLTRDIERCRVELEKEQKTIVVLREGLRKMEGDVARYRAEIGEQRWREITSAGFAGANTGGGVGGGAGGKS